MNRTVRKLLLGLSICTLTAVCCLAQDEKPPMDLPVYPGGSTTMEINMTSEELLSIFQAMAPTLTERFGPFGEAISMEDLADIVKNVKRIEFLQIEIGKPSVTHQQIADFYSKKLPSGQWSRVALMSDEASTTAVYAQPGVEQIYGFRTASLQREGKKIQRIQVGKIEGKIDFVRAFKLIGKLINTFFAAH